MTRDNENFCQVLFKVYSQKILNRESSTCKRNYNSTSGDDMHRFLTQEYSKGGLQKILLITDHFTKYAQFYPTKNKTA